MPQKHASVKAIIFDLGGTLYRPAHDLRVDFLTELGITTHEGRSYDELVAILMQSAGQWLDKYMVDNQVGQHWRPTDDIWLEYDKRFLMALGVTENLDRLAREYQAKWDDLLARQRPSLIDGCHETLIELRRRGLKLGIASNRFTDPARMLRNDGILHLFDAIEYSNVPGLRKPSPFLLNKVANKIGVIPSKCLYVGNRVDDDVVAAQRAGMQPVLITWCESDVSPQELDPSVIIIDHIADLLRLTG